MTPSPPPLVDSRELRPGRGWYVVGGLLALVCVVAGMTLGALGFASLADAVPRIQQPFRSGETVVVSLTAATNQVLYIDRLSAGEPCSGTSLDGGTVDFAPPLFDFSFTDEGGRRWHAYKTVRASQDGRYEIVCPRPDVPPAATYVLGQDVQHTGVLGTLFWGVAALVGLPCLGVVAGGTVMLVTALRRSGHRHRLLRQRTAAPSARPPQAG